MYSIYTLGIITLSIVPLTAGEMPRIVGQVISVTRDMLCTNDRYMYIQWYRHNGNNIHTTLTNFKYVQIHGNIL